MISHNAEVPLPFLVSPLNRAKTQFVYRKIPKEFLIKIKMNQRIHAKYFSRFLNLLPPKLGNHDSTRATIAFFAVSGIDVLDSMSALSAEAKQHIIEWILSLQVKPKEGSQPCGGFQV
jgi:prenyltransferase beta subunit